ncbi:MAG: hypothetical protein KDD42_04325 [Bdellovibrionales bacterium]|nr:hypothetical protein [Bdellovibrionales bacterium]
MLKSLKQLNLWIFFLFSTPLAATAGDFDVDADGLDDVILVEATDSALLWSALLSSTGFSSSQSLGQVGSNGDHLIPATWTDSNSPQIGIISKSANSNVVTWTILNSSEQQSQVFGSKNTDLFLSGDFDGNGQADAAKINRKTGASTIFSNLFSSSSTQSTLSFPRAAARKGHPFFVDIDGTGDNMSLIYNTRSRSKRKIKLVSIGLNGRKVIRRFRGQLGSKTKEAFPIRQPNGVDAIGTVGSSSSATNLKIINLTGGGVVFKRKYPRGTVLVGDYLSADGEEVALFREGTLLIQNPFSQESLEVSNLPNSVAADELNFNSFITSSNDSNEDNQGSGIASVCPKGSVGFAHTRLLKPSSDVSDNRGGKPAVLLTGSSKSGASAMEVYDTKGNTICRFTFKDSSVPGVNSNADHYFSGHSGGCSKTASQIKAQAQQNTGSSSVYFSWKGGQCLGPADPTTRQGSI